MRLPSSPAACPRALGSLTDHRRPPYNLLSQQDRPVRRRRGRLAAQEHPVLRPLPFRTGRRWRCSRGPTNRRPLPALPIRSAPPRRALRPPAVPPPSCASPISLSLTDVRPALSYLTFPHPLPLVTLRSALPLRVSYVSSSFSSSGLHLVHLLSPLASLSPAHARARLISRPTPRALPLYTPPPSPPSRRCAAPWRYAR